VTYDELKIETDRLRALREAVQAELLRFPGVRGVGIGVRQTRGQLTGELAFRVYVGHKVPRARLAAGELIPARIAGYATDVHQIVIASPVCCGATRPVLAGLPIEAEPFRSLTDAFGTLGCFLRLPPDNTEVGLTNEHVLESKFESDTRVFQPEYKNCAGFTCNVIGNSVPKLAQRGTFTFNGQDHYVDAAVVDLAKVDFVNQLVDGTSTSASPSAVTLPPNVPGSITVDDKGKIVQVHDGSNNLVNLRAIRGTAQAVPNTLVFKVGKTTGLTVGVVSDIVGTGEFGDGPIVVEGPNQIIILPVAGFRAPAGSNGSSGGSGPPVEHYLLGGDSGSVCLDLSNKVVGLNHHVATHGDRHGVASNIAPVLASLGGATVIDDDGSSSHKTASPSNQLARQLWIDAPMEAHDLDGMEREVRASVSRSARGRALLELVDKHAGAVAQLIWNRRPVTVAWHRHHGPAFVVLFARAQARPGTPLPTEAGGVSRRALVLAMADALSAHGDATLRADIESVRGWLVDVVVESRSIEELADRLLELAA
jgi:hypothetical protein